MNFTTEERATLTRLTSILFPPEPDGVGAIEVGVLSYIDNVLSDEGAHFWSLYRAGLAWFDSETQQQGYPRFVDLDPSQQEEIVGRVMALSEAISLMSGGPSSSYGGLNEVALTGAIPAPPLRAGLDEPDGRLAGPSGAPVEALFMAVLWQHVREGLFADPRHGGNRDAMIWRWMGYNGPQLNGYTDSEILEDAVPRRPLKIFVDWKNHRA
jgi:hypothetical protein